MTREQDRKSTHKAGGQPALLWCLQTQPNTTATFLVFFFFVCLFFAHLFCVDLDVVVEKVKANRVEGEPGVLRVVSMARLAPEKKIDVLIDAFALVLKELPNSQLEIAGKGMCKDELIAQVKSLGIEKNVNFSGFNDPFVVMGRNDALVQLSIAENNSYTLLEAKAAGLKVLATAMGGNPEQLEAEEMVPALTATNRELIVSEAARKIIEMADQEYKIPTDFTWSTTREMTDRIATKYARVIHS